MTKIAKFTLLAAGLTASTLLVSCKKKNIVFSGSSQTVDEKWDEKITTDVEITFNPNDYTFEEIEREYIEETDKENDEIEETVFKRRGEYDGNPKKNGELILYYNGESVNGGSYNAYVEDVVFTVKKGTFFYGWDESIEMTLSSILEKAQRQEKARQETARKKSLKNNKGDSEEIADQVPSLIQEETDEKGL